MSESKTKYQKSRLSKGVKYMPNTKFTEEDDKKLIEIMKNGTNMSWADIAKQLGTTAPASYISARWRSVLNPNILKGSWSEEEDKTIIEWVKKHGKSSWKGLSNVLKNRTGKQLKNRWEVLIKRDVKWTREEDKKLEDLHDKYGNQWARIAYFMHNRTSHEIKNRWNSTISRIKTRRNLGLPLEEKRGRKPNLSKVNTRLSDVSHLNFPIQDIPLFIDTPSKEENLRPENKETNLDEIWYPVFPPY